MNFVKILRVTGTVLLVLSIITLAAELATIVITVQSPIYQEVRPYWDIPFRIFDAFANNAEGFGIGVLCLFASTYVLKNGKSGEAFHD